MAYIKKKLDGRTRSAKEIRQMQKLISDDLDKAAVQILERDIAYLAIFGDRIFKKDMNTKGLSDFLKIHASIKSALVALKKFQGAKPAGLAGLFDDTDDEE